MNGSQPESQSEGVRNNGLNTALSVIDVSKILANRTRVDVLRALVEASGEKGVLDVACELELDESTVSRALRTFRTAGLAHRRAAKNHHFYRVAEQIEVKAMAQQLHITIPCRDGALSIKLNRTPL